MNKYKNNSCKMKNPLKKSLRCRNVDKKQTKKTKKKPKKKTKKQTKKK